MCAESSRFGPRNQAQETIIHKKRGRPSVTSPQKVLKVCNKCLSITHPGIGHPCLKTTLKYNAHKIFDHHQALNTFVGDDIIRRSNSPNETATRLQLPTSSGGHPLHLTVNERTLCT